MALLDLPFFPLFGFLVSFSAPSVLGFLFSNLSAFADGSSRTRATSGGVCCWGGALAGVPWSRREAHGLRAASQGRRGRQNTPGRLLGTNMAASRTPLEAGLQRQ